PLGGMIGSARAPATDSTRLSMAMSSRPGSVQIAMVCAGAVTAQYIAGKAARNALYLASFDPRTLTAMGAATSVVSIVLVAVCAKALGRRSPARYVPVLFGASAAMLFAEWALSFQVPKAAAVLVYLHISGVGPILGSGFWLIASERFDPRTAKRRLGQIQGVGTISGVLVGFATTPIANTPAILLPILAALHVVAAIAIPELARPAAGLQPVKAGRVPAAAAMGRRGLRVLLEAPYLSSLAVVVWLGTTSAWLLDYALNVEAVQTFGRLRVGGFFSIYYSAISLITFAAQTTAARFVLERLGLAWTAASPSLGLMAGGVG